MPIKANELKWFSETEVKIYSPDWGSGSSITAEELYQAIKARLLVELAEQAGKDD